MELPGLFPGMQNETPLRWRVLFGIKIVILELYCCQVKYLRRDRRLRKTFIHLGFRTPEGMDGSGLAGETFAMRCEEFDQTRFGPVALGSRVA